MVKNSKPDRRAGFRRWLLAGSIIAALGGTAIVCELAAPLAPAQAKDKEPLGDHWRNHDGHWSYWHAGDKCWYYTDGTHWFYNDGKQWKLYRFDHEFGKHFHHGEYKPPAEGIKISLPHHKIVIGI